MAEIQLSKTHRVCARVQVVHVNCVSMCVCVWPIRAANEQLNESME